MIVAVGCTMSAQMKTSRFALKSVGNSSTLLVHLAPMEQTVLTGKMALMEATVQTD